LLQVEAVAALEQQAVVEALVVIELHQDLRFLRDLLLLSQ
jgi:hypothetical protein